jgi:hypothetical protein
MKIVLDQYNELEGFNLGLENIIADKIKIWLWTILVSC